MAGTAAPATDPATGAPPATGTPPPAGSAPATGAPATPPADPDDLGPKGLKALQEERARADRAERAAAAAAQERDALKAQHSTAEEKALEKAKNEGAAEATLAANRRIAKSEARGFAAGKFVDVDDAVTLLGDLDRFIVKDEVDTGKIETAMADLLKAKPHLAAAGGRPRPLPGGGATQSSGTSFNDTIRDKIHRRG